MRTAAILVASLLATIGRAAPMSESADNGLQLYKRQPLPPLTKGGEPSQSDVEMEGGVSNTPAQRVRLPKPKKFGTALKRMKGSGHRRRPKSPNQEEQSADVDELMTGDSDSDSHSPVPKNAKTSQSDDETEGVKGKVSNKLAKGANLFKKSRFGIALQRMKMSGLKSQSKSDLGSTTEDIDMEDSSSSLDLSLPEHFPPPLDSPLPPLSLDTLPPPPPPPPSS
ncbi:hypothetical protein BASA60_009427, partial [Batrachochytrium salamandrivorans]